MKKGARVHVIGRLAESKWTVTATDEANNPSTAAFTIDVVDTTPPTMTAPART